ncbi:MAG: HK97 family phage prohead protease [Rhizorhabdus sp.]
MKKTTLAGGKLEIKLAEPGADIAVKSFTGYGAVFNNRDHASDVIAPGAFAKTLAEHKSAGTAPQMFFNHAAYTMPIGVWKSMEEDSYGLKVSGEFLDTAGGRDAYAATKAGAVTGLSIGYIPTAYEIDGDVRTITEAKLVEISVVTWPCNELARVSDVKSVSDDEFLEKLNELGVEEDDAKALLAKRRKSDDGVESEADEEEVDEEASDDTEEDREAKYDEAAVVAAIKAILITTKEIHVR